MNIDKNTKLIARLHTGENATGLNIYNPYFQDQSLNAVYLLFRGNEPAPLIQGVRDLNITGAISAGFEHDGTMLDLVDELSEAAKLSGRVGIISNRDGKLYGHYQGGEGLLAAIKGKTNLSGKKLIIVGAGAVAKTLLLAICSEQDKPKEILIVNRTQKHAEQLKQNFRLVTSIHGLDDLIGIEGDVLINATRIGSSVRDEIFTKEIVNKYDVIADVTFGNENSVLINLAKSEQKLIVTGWDMFTFQVAVVLRELLSHNANIDRLRYFVTEGLAITNHGAQQSEVKD